MKNLSAYKIFSLAWVSTILILPLATTFAQYRGSAITSPEAGESVSESAIHAQYTDIPIMPGDLLSITTYGAPELSIAPQNSSGTIMAASSPIIEGLRVGTQGEITLPYVGSIKIAGKTPSQASTFLCKLFKDGGILTDPQVTVAILDSPNRIVTVIGEVQRPAPVAAFGRIRLLDAISACGGLTALASHTITIHRLGEVLPITVQLGVDPETSNMTNVALLAGDTVVVPRVGNVFVIGEVKTQLSFPLSSNAPITVMRAVAMAGGLNFGAALSNARIIRTAAGTRQEEIRLDLKKIMFGKEKDIALLSDDVLFIPGNAFKSALAAGGASVAASFLYEASYASSILR